MTTIAYRDGVMAADSLITCDGRREAFVSKIREINGWLIGIAGTWGVAEEFFAWFGAECRDFPKRPPTSLLVDDDKHPISVLMVNRQSGKVYLIDGLGFPYPATNRFFAIGSGMEYAIGAMQMGATAKKAVAAAIKFDGASGGTIRTMKRK